MVERIRDVDSAVGIHRHAAWSAKAGGGAGAVGVAPFARQARQSGNHAAGRHLANGAVAQIGDIQIAAGVDRQAAGSFEARAGTGAVIAPAQPGCTREGGDNACWRHFADGVVIRIGDVDVPAGIHRHSHWRRKTCLGSGAVDVAPFSHGAG